jgi:hypothetical protein
MDGRKKEIRRREEALGRLERKIADEAASIGRCCQAREGAPKALRTLLECSRSLQEAAEGFRRAAAEVRARVLDVERAEREAAEHARAGEAALKEAAEAYPALGLAAYARWRELPDPSPWAALFGDLERLRGRTEAAEAELRSLEHPAGLPGFFDRVKAKARALLLKADLSRCERRRREVAAEVGSRLAVSDFPVDALAEVFARVREPRSRAAAHGADAARRLGEAREARAALVRLEALEDPSARIRDLEARIAAVAVERDAVHERAGRIAVDAGLETDSGAFRQLEEAAREQRRAIDRLKAEDELEAWERRERETRERRVRLDDEARLVHRRLSAADLELNAGILRAEELRRVIAGELPYVPVPPLPGPAPE